MSITDTCPRIKQQQQAVDRAVAAEKRQRARRKPLGDRVPLAEPASAERYLLRAHAERVAAQPLLDGETVEQWMERTGQQPETLPNDAASGKNVTAWNGRTVPTK